MALPHTTITISNIDSATGNTHITKIRAVVDSAIRRSIGSTGDAVTLTVDKADWPVGYDELGDFEININQGQGIGAQLILKGYKLKVKLPSGMGGDITDGSAPVEATQYRLLLETQLKSMRDGFGNLLTIGTLNPLDQEGHVDTQHADYKNNQELVDLCLEAIGLDFEPSSPGLNAGVDSLPVDAPGPLDWGNARPLSELDALLSRLGWVVVQLNDGTIATRRLLRAGQPINIPAPIAAVAEPYELGTMPGIRASKIIVTSGATRATVITTRTLEYEQGDAGFPNAKALEWVIFDAETNEWIPQAVGAIDDYQAGLTASDLTPEDSKAIGQLFRAVRLTGDDLLESGTFVNIPTTVDYGELAKFAGGPGVVEASACVKSGADQLINVPKLNGVHMRLDGLRAISGQGVFVLPSDGEYVRLEDGLDTGRRGDAREMHGDELLITYAHEANTGVFTDDYFVVGFEWQQNNGVVTINTMTPQEVEDSLDDPSVVKVGLPMLRAVMTLDEADPNNPLWVGHNSVQLTAIAKQVATARISDSLVESGPIVLRGLIDINPGDIQGAVTSVSWDVTRHITIITINTHEVPRSFYERLQRQSGYAIASGIGGMRLSRSSASLGDLRNTLVASDALPIDGTSTPESNPKLRGRTMSLSGVKGVEHAGVHTRRDLPTIAEQSTIHALITGATLISPNKWEYDWAEMRIVAGSGVTTNAKRSSATHGKARNFIEMFNTSAGVQGNGIDLDTLDDGFEIQPAIVGKTPMVLSGPYSGDSPLWFFSYNNAVDGVCS
ncbi:hypothetical protein COB72_03485 [bacterium]|nr:MAG: hypothetical protein COB72_03485 [bacterium]